MRENEGEPQAPFRGRGLGVGTNIGGISRQLKALAQKKPPAFVPEALKAAATYSPTWCRSTIGASELNFSVRDGKRWILTAITA